MIMTVIEGEWYNKIKSYGEKNRIDKNRTYIEQPKEASYLDLHRTRYWAIYTPGG